MYISLFLLNRSLHWQHMFYRRKGFLVLYNKTMYVCFFNFIFFNYNFLNLSAHIWRRIKIKNVNHLLIN